MVSSLLLSPWLFYITCEQLSVMLQKVVGQYEWFKPRPPPGEPVQPAIRPVPGAKEVKAYDPLEEHPDLYRRFAGIEPLEQEQMLEFVSRYGLLGLPDYSDREPLSVLNEERYTMWRVLEIWDGMRNGTTCGLAASVPAEVESARTSERRRRQRIAYHARRIEETVAGRLAVHAGAGLVARYEEPSVTFQLLHEPRTLLGALWLQCAMALSGQREFRKCRQCGKEFEVSTTLRSPETRRLDARFCPGARCRAGYHQHCRAKARRLHGEGLSIIQITDELGESREQVRKWLKATKPRARRKWKR